MSDDLNERVATLEAQVRELTDALRETLAIARPVAMRDARRCAVCEGTALLVVAATQFTPTEPERIGALGLVQANTWKGPTVLGPLEYVACRQCGRVETYTRDLHDVNVGKNGVRVLESEPDKPPPPRGPYR